MWDWHRVLAYVVCGLIFAAALLLVARNCAFRRAHAGEHLVLMYRCGGGSSGNCTLAGQYTDDEAFSCPVAACNAFELNIAPRVPSLRLARSSELRMVPASASSLIGFTADSSPDGVQDGVCPPASCASSSQYSFLCNGEPAMPPASGTCNRYLWLVGAWPFDAGATVGLLGFGLQDCGPLVPQK